MHITTYHVARANPVNRRRLALALGLRANATIAQIVKAANAHIAPTLGRWS